MTYIVSIVTLNPTIPIPLGTAEYAQSVSWLDDVICELNQTLVSLLLLNC